MNVDVALQAIREFLEHDFTVRLPVTFLALRDVPVLRMAFRARDLTVLARGGADLLIDLSVASAAHVVFRRIRIFDFQRIVRRVADQALFVLLSLRVRLVALHASRDISVLFTVALSALDFRVFARVRQEFLTDLGVAVSARFREFRRHRHLGFRGMRIRMTDTADRELFAVVIAVTGLTLRHDLVPILLFRVVRMEDRMALHAVDLVLAAFILYLAENGIVATGAFFGRQWLDVHFVRRFRLHRFRCRRNLGFLSDRHRSLLCSRRDLLSGTSENDTEQNDRDREQQNSFRVPLHHFLTSFPKV